MKRHYRILLIESDEDNSSLIQMILESRNYEVIVAKDGEEAIHWTEEKCPDLVLVDIILPGRDGYEVTKEMKQRMMMVPIVAIGPVSTSEAKAKAFACGCQEYILKPFEIEKFLNVIEENLIHRN
ncbi:MAG: response regulator [Candidatus Edwardsbacteria bacterium]